MNSEIQIAVDDILPDVRRVSRKKIFFSDGKSYTVENFHKYLDLPTVFRQAIKNGWGEIYEGDVIRVARKIFFALKKIGIEAETDYELVMITNPKDVIMNHPQFAVYGPKEEEIFFNIAPTTHPHLLDTAYDGLREGTVKKFYVTSDRECLDKIYTHKIPGVGACYVYNTYSVPEYRKIKWDPEDDSYLDLVDVVKHVMPCPRSRERFYSWLSLSLHKRCRTMLVLQGPQKIGKTLMLQLSEALHGIDNTARIAQDFGNQRFSDGIYQKTLAIGDEFKTGDMKGYERMKALVEDRITIEQKGRAELSVQNVTSFILTSNLPNCLPLNGSTDRKFDYLDMTSKKPKRSLVNPFIEALGLNNGEPNLQAIRGLYERLKHRWKDIDHSEDFKTERYEYCLYESVGVQKRYLIDLCLGRIDMTSSAFFDLDEFRKGEIPLNILEQSFMDHDRRRKTYLQPSTISEFLRNITWGLKPLARVSNSDANRTIQILQGPLAYDPDMTWREYFDATDK